MPYIEILSLTDFVAKKKRACERALRVKLFLIDEEDIEGVSFAIDD
jgi:hypothetical protein